MRLSCDEGWVCKDELPCLDPDKGLSLPVLETLVYKRLYFSKLVFMPAIFYLISCQNLVIDAVVGQR